MAASCDNSRWLWDALCRLKAELVMSRLVPHDWDWNQIHPVHGTPLMAIVSEGIRWGENRSEVAAVWRLLRWCFSQGADPRKEAPVSVSGRSGGYGGSDAWPKIESEPHAGHSAISLAIAIEAKLSKHQAKYDAQIRNAQKMFQLMAEFVPARRGSVVAVPEAVADIWEGVLLDSRCSDAELRISLPDGKLGGAIRAHSAVLRRASPVLDALFASPMREGQTGVVRVEGATDEGVRLLLQLIYTGTITGEDPEVPELLIAMDLAHRWQIGHVVEMLEWSLAGKVDVAHFNALCEAAVLKGLPALRSACRSFAGTNRDVQAALQRGELGETTSHELGACLGGPSNTSAGSIVVVDGGVQLPTKKRRRLL